MGEKSKPIRQEPLHKGTCSGSIWVFHGILGSKQGLRRSAKKLHAEGARKRDQLNREKGSRDAVPCRVQGQRPCWGLGQRPNCSAGDQYVKRAQQKCRQRSVPASNFARPQTRPKLLFPPKFREKPTIRIQKTDRAKLLCRFFLILLILPADYTAPCAIIASATFRKPAMFAPAT